MTCGGGPNETAPPLPAAAHKRAAEVPRHRLGSASSARLAPGARPHHGAAADRWRQDAGAAEIINLGRVRAAGAFPVIFTVPRIGLVNQTVKAFWAEGIRDIGILQGTRKQTRSAQVQVASVQTLPNR